MSEEQKWEVVTASSSPDFDETTERLKIHNGWLYRSTMIDRTGTSLELGHAPRFAISITFVPEAIKTSSVRVY